jgi:glutamate carboxypeptidase
MQPPLTPLEPIVAALRELVDHESPSRDKAALDTLASVIADRLARAGGIVERRENPKGGDHLIARFFTEQPGAPALLVGHFDTVWPIGTLALRPFKIEGDKIYGPGIFDMKGGLVLAEFALASLRAANTPPPRPVVCLFTSDEEIGSPTSRALVEELAREAAYALILEPPLPDGSLKTARKGVGHFRVEVDGVSAHAGLEPEKGRSALVELAHQVLALQALNNPADGTTVTAGIAGGGTTSNVVPSWAWAELDVRASTLEAAARVEAALKGLTPVTPDTKIRVSGGFNRPPLERSSGVVALAQQAQRIGATLGLTLGEGAAGGGSDGNFTAAIGLPTLDGLGAPGIGAHAEYEHVELSPLPLRTAFLAKLLLELEPPPRA